MKNKFSMVSTSQEALLLLVGLYTAVSISMNIFCMKALSWGTNIVFSDGGQVVSWSVFLISNIIAEVWGEKLSVKVITFSAITTGLLLVIGRLLVFVPTTSDYAFQSEAFAQIFSNGPRTIASSIFAYWVGGFVNVHIIAVLKRRWEKSDNSGKFFLRASFSSFIGQIVDNALFMIFAFAPLSISAYEMLWKDIFSSVIIGSIIEVVIESFLIPFVTIPITKKLQSMKSREEGLA